MIDPQRLDHAFAFAREALLSERNADGFWEGELATSALATATAIGAFSRLRAAETSSSPSEDTLIENGIAWLVRHQNSDGGWGDTDKSVSNISTTMLCRAAFHLAGVAERHEATLQRAIHYLDQKCGPGVANHAEGIRARYGKDRTFSVPILCTAALAGLVEWREVPRLPFELACFPQSWFRFLQLPVVSYALPALIALGQLIETKKPSWNPILRLVRWAARGTSLRVLQAIQPSSGGYLEAVPLTSFVLMSLASIGHANHPVANLGRKFLRSLVRSDGSWPIDTNLALWVTTLSVNALATNRPSRGSAPVLESDEEDAKLCKWIVSQQSKERHPYTGAEPGSWGWTNLPGSVPDADDTPGAILAILNLAGTANFDRADISNLDRDGIANLDRAGERGVLTPRENQYPNGDSHGSASVQEPSRRAATTGGLHPPLAVRAGIRWLARLQNHDGGIPTFCRGWANLPFDRSGSDLTAHYLRAIAATEAQVPTPSEGPREPSLGVQARTVDRAIRPTVDRAFRYLARHQRPDGSWLPLWFGNQHAPDDENPTYGTSRVLVAYAAFDATDSEPAKRGIRWLLNAQNSDGSWGGAKGIAGSVEETALAIDTLLQVKQNEIDAISRGIAWLIKAVETKRIFEPEPIGFYFAKLWYYERLYPIIFTVSALGRARRWLASLPTRSPSLPTFV